MQSKQRSGAEVGAAIQVDRITELDGRAVHYEARVGTRVQADPDGRVLSMEDAKEVMSASFSAKPESEVFGDDEHGGGIAHYTIRKGRGAVQLAITELDGHVLVRSSVYQEADGRLRALAQSRAAVCEVANALSRQAMGNGTSLLRKGPVR